MPSIPLLRTRTRALLITSFFVFTLAIASVWTVSQRASIQANHNLLSSSMGRFLPEKGGVVPAAANITVNSTTDVANGTDGLCTLREAITAANNNVASGGVAGECIAGSSSGSDAIDATGVTGTINLTAALPDLTTILTITGPGAGQLTVRRDTGGDYRIFAVTSGNVSISGLTVTNGKAPGVCCSAFAGGGILNAGTLTLIDVVVVANTAGAGIGGITGGGGGIVNTGTLSVRRSSFSNNTVTGNAFGGAIYNNASPGVVTLENSTISGNSAHSGAGIISFSTLSITNCTITGNVNDPADAAFGNGLISSGSAATIRNTIVAGNGGNADVSGTFSSQGHNLVGRVGGATGFTNGSNGDQVGTTGSPINPQLGPLANNGGPTPTHALLANSTALDAGDNCVTDVAHCGDANIFQMLTDQRGTPFNRLVDGPDVDTTATVDIGASETQVTLANLADTSTLEDTQVLAVFDGGDTSSITSVTATSDNASLVPNDAAHLSVAMTGSTGVVTINPAANANGTTNITVTVNRTGGPESKTFMLTVNSANDAPSFMKGADQVTNEDNGVVPTTGWATNISPGSADESGQVLTFQVTGNTNAALFSAGPAISPTGTLTFTPAANANGSATITINLKDDGGTGSGGVDTSVAQTFTITVNPVNDAPSFTKGANQTVNEDAGGQTVASWATGISAGPNEAGQTLSFTATNDNNALFSSQPAISSAGTLTYTPAANANGSATVTVSLKDNGGTANVGVDTSAAQTFTITVNSVNDAPAFTKGANQTVNEDAGVQTVTNWATAISPGPAEESGQAVGFGIINNTNAALFSVAPAVSSTGTLTYTPAANANGSTTITLVIGDDGGTANGGVNTSATQTFTITVNSVNDVPSFTKGADQAVSNNAGAQTVTNWATAISAGPGNESGQTLTFQITNNTNSALFSSGPAISSNGTLSYTPASNAGGTATITIRLQDNGGTANGGVDTSASQTFNITINPLGGSINFSAATYNTTESSGFTTVTVKRTGDLTRAVTVDYASSGNNSLPCSTANGVATPKCDFTTALGTLSFGSGEDTKLVEILISQDGFVEGPETFTVALSNPTNNAALGTTSTSMTTIADDATEPATNVIDDARNFVRQHYHDFLNREPDQSGWDFWTNQITSCGSDVQCNEVRRIDVSASFFLSIEFQQTGYLVERFYKVGYADATGNSTFGNPHTLAVPIVRANEFLADTQRIGRGVVVLAPGWEQVLENNKQAYALEFVQTTRFITALPTSMSPSQFVTRLNQNTGGVLSLSEQQTAINLFGGAGNTANVNARAQAVRMVADDQDLYNAEFNRAFVLAQYFGYLRRNPNDAPDSDYTGYDFWLTKLNQFNGNYINAEMVKAFLSSIEYRQRFGP